MNPQQPATTQPQPAAPAPANNGAPEEPLLTGVRKRQQIENTNRHIFMWLAGAAIIVSISLVALQFLAREFLFNQKIINEMSKTNKTLDDDIAAGKALQTKVNALITDHTLDSLKYQSTNTKTTGLNVILDALPVDGDATAFANSLQAMVLPRSGVAIRSLPTSTDAGVDDGATDPATTGSASSAPTLAFKAGFDGSYDQVKQAFTDIERVIRPINLTKLELKAKEGGALQVDVEGVTYYQPARTLDLKDKEIKP